MTLASATVIVHVTRLWSDPFGSSAQAEPPALVAAFSLALAALAVSVAAVVVRFARSVGEERLQLKWFAAAANATIPAAADDCPSRRNRI